MSPPTNFNPPAMAAASKLRTSNEPASIAVAERQVAPRRVEVSSERRAEESWLREFCEAALGLLNSTGTTDSILSDILPSLIAELGESFRDGAPLRAEYESWRVRSEHLVRLASLHFGNVETIVRSVDFARVRVTTLLESLDELQQCTQTPLITIFETNEDGPSADASPQGQASTSRRVTEGEHCLKQICQSILDLSAPGDDANSVLSQTVPSVLQLFRGCDPQVLQLLRSEWRNWKASTSPLLDLVEVHCPAEGNELR